MISCSFQAIRHRPSEFSPQPQRAFTTRNDFEKEEYCSTNGLSRDAAVLSPTTDNKGLETLLVLFLVLANELSVALFLFLPNLD